MPDRIVIDKLDLHKHGPRIQADAWRAEMQAAGKRVPDGGLVFTYTDASGLPAEVYGP